uniref:Uncharacterized protein n=1 Tax=Panagrolaimus sp. JU765 TaxID=591449 RepID=A0AC34QX99_9BILA
MEFPLVLDGIRFDVADDGLLKVSDLFLEESHVLSCLKAENVCNICSTENDIVFQLRNGLTVDENALFVAFSLPSKTIYAYSNNDWKELEEAKSTLFGEFDSVVACQKRTTVLPQAGKCCCTTLYEIHVFEVDFDRKTTWKVFSNCKENARFCKTLEFEIKTISSGSNHILIVDDKGRVFVYGSGLHGELGLGNADIEMKFPLVLDGVRFDVADDGLLKVSDLRLEESHVLSCLKAENACNICSTENEIVFQLRNGLTVDENALFVAFALPSKTVYAYSNNDWKELEEPKSTLFGEVGFVFASLKVIIQILYQIATGAFHNLILTNCGDVYAFGWNKNGVLGPGMPEGSTMIMEPLPMDLSKSVVKIEAGDYLSRVFYSDGTNECFGGDSASIFDI